MLRLENLIDVYEDFSENASDSGAIKGLDLTKPNNRALTTLYLIEAERFWNAILLQLLGYHHLQKIWLSTWADVTLYYASYYAMNGLMRLAGRTITHSDKDRKVYKITRDNANPKNYVITKSPKRSDHNVQWNFYYELIQKDITEDKFLRGIFAVQLDFRHYEREGRQLINYDLEHGFDERHHSNNLLREISATLSSTFPFEHTDEAFDMDAYAEISVIIYIWKHMKYLFNGIAEKTNFSYYWELQKSKLNDFVTDAPINDDLKKWALVELKT